MTEVHETVDRNGAGVRVGDRIIDHRGPELSFVGRVERMYSHGRGTAIDYREIRSAHLRTTLAERVEYDWTQLAVSGQSARTDDQAGG